MAEALTKELTQKQENEYLHTVIMGLPITDAHYDGEHRQYMFEFDHPNPTRRGDERRGLV